MRTKKFKNSKKSLTVSGKLRSARFWRCIVIVLGNPVAISPNYRIFMEKKIRIFSCTASSDDPSVLTRFVLRFRFSPFTRTFLLFSLKKKSVELVFPSPFSPPPVPPLRLYSKFSI